MAKTLRVVSLMDPRQVYEYVNTNTIPSVDIQRGLTRTISGTSTTFLYFWWDSVLRGVEPTASPGIKDAHSP
jgi:hypothetical protein